MCKNSDYPPIFIVPLVFSFLIAVCLFAPLYSIKNATKWKYLAIQDTVVFLFTLAYFVYFVVTEIDTCYYAQAAVIWQGLVIIALIIIGLINFLKVRHKVWKVIEKKYGKLIRGIQDAQE
jgi:hypothetical protein